jgi:hypothetical protein
MLVVVAEVQQVPAHLLEEMAEAELAHPVLRLLLKQELMVVEVEAEAVATTNLALVVELADLE